MNLAIY